MYYQNYGTRSSFIDMYIGDRDSSWPEYDLAQWKKL